MDTVSVTGVVCPCPGTPHPDGDTVDLFARLDLPRGAELQSRALLARQLELDGPALIGYLKAAYVRVGVAGWTLVDDEGKAEPVTPDNIERLLISDFGRAAPIAEKADELYFDPVLAPLLNGAARSSHSTTTVASTSANGSTSHKPRRRSRPSSTSTTPTAATEATSE